MNRAKLRRQRRKWEEVSYELADYEHALRSPLSNLFEGEETYTILRSDLEALTVRLHEHPEWWTGPCNCASCAGTRLAKFFEKNGGKGP